MHQKKSFWYLTFMQYKWAKYFIPHLDHLNFNTMQLLFIFYIEICRNYKLYLYSDIFIFFVLIIYIIYGTQYFLNKWWYSHEGKCLKGKCSDFTALNIFHTHSVIHLFFLYLWIIWHSSIKADKFCFWKKKDCFTSY